MRNFTLDDIGGGPTGRCCIVESAVLRNMLPIPELLEMHRKGEIPEALLFDRLVDWIWEKPIIEIMSFLDKGQQSQFTEDLKAISRPGWFDFRDGWKPPEKLLAAIHEYFEKKQ